MDCMLPDDGLNKNYVLAREDYYFVYPTRFHEYERQYRGIVPARRRLARGDDPAAA